MDDHFSLHGQHAVITGGTRGIGRAITMRFAAAGASVIANYVRDDAAAQAIREEASARGCAVETCRADVTTEKGLGRLVAAVQRTFPGVSIFVHCAATGVHRPFEQLTSRHFDWTYRLNVRAFLELLHRLLPLFVRPAAVLAISSEGAMRALPNYSLVGSSKSALESLVRHSAVELAVRGIRVNALSAGTVLTDAWKVLPDAERRLADSASRSPLRRLTTVDEIAWAAQFLCSPAATAVVGETLVVDGGVSLVG